MIDSSQVISIIKKEIGDRNININSELGRQEGWDSLSHVKIIRGVEQAFSIKVEPHELSRLTSIKKIIEYLNTH